MKTFVLAILTIFQTGCVSSSYIASVGARTIEGNQSDYKSNKDFELPLNKFKREVSSMAVVHGAFLPYTNLFKEKDGKEFGIIKFKHSDIKWSAEQKGVLTGFVNNKKIVFDVSINKGNLELKHKFRKWYSYPSQCLLIVTMPLDLAIDIVAAPVILTASLIDKN